MEVACSSLMLVYNQKTKSRNNSEDQTLKGKTKLLNYEINGFRN
jgi:hypothetical protein